MTTKDKVARRKLSLLQLADELSNVLKALQGDGLFAPAAPRNPAELSDLWG